MQINYIQELNELELKKSEIIEQAKKEGYKYIDGQLIKNDYTPVIEAYVRGETQYESYGSFYLFKKTILIKPEYLEIINDSKFDIESILEILYEGFFVELKELDKFFEIIDMCSHMGGLYKDDEFNIIEKDELKNRYYLNKDQKLYYEFFFSSGKGVNGYISIYDIPTKDLEKQDTIDITYKKYLKDN